jgi:predicted DNA binding CopG/RHH family protein
MFDKEELAILEALENDTLVKSINADEEIAVAKKVAKEYLSKSKNITLRMNMMDLVGIKEKSKEIGIPYQTIISSLVHNYVNGKVKLSYS